MSIAMHLLRVTIEARTPLAVGSGRIVERTVMRPNENGMGKEKVQVQAAAIMRDANGLPTIPGGSTQGVLRHLMAETLGEDGSREVFGYEDANGDGQSSAVSISWGHVHDSNDTAIVGLQERDLSNDPYLKLLLDKAPIWRDRVALSATHSVDERKKFARVAVPVGTRFSIEFVARGGTEKRDLLLKVARLLRHRRFRLGACSGVGWGRVSIVRASYQAIDLSDQALLRSVLQQPTSTSLSENVIELDAFTPPDLDATVVTLSLNFDDALRIGGAGSTDDNNIVGEGNLLSILREPLFTQDVQGTGAVLEHYPLAGSGLRGALSHRMQFYARKDRGDRKRFEGETREGASLFADDLIGLDETEQKNKLAELEARNDLLVAFLGEAKEADLSGDVGASSRLIVGETDLTSGTIQTVQHVAIDRFTGGAMDVTGALYEEQWLVGAYAKLELQILPPRRRSNAPDAVNGWDLRVARCFLKTLRDLCSGRMPIGANSLGVCRGSVSWSGPGAKEWSDAAETLGMKEKLGAAA